MSRSCYGFSMLMHQLRVFCLFFSLIASKFPDDIRDGDLDEKDKEEGQKNTEEDLTSGVDICMIKKI